MTLNILNKKLEDTYGRLEDRARYRVVWSHDELEKRTGIFRDFVPGTNMLIREVYETREVPKYRQWCNPPSYILERITPYTEANTQGELIGKLGYEPLHVFRANGPEFIPSWPACSYLIEVVIEATKSPGSYVKYKDPDSDPEQARQNAKEEIDKIMEELFGNETDVTDALKYKEGVVVPSNFSIN